MDNTYIELNTIKSFNYISLLLLLILGFPILYLYHLFNLRYFLETLSHSNLGKRIKSYITGLNLLEYSTLLGLEILNNRTNLGIITIPSKSNSKVVISTIDIKSKMSLNSILGIISKIMRLNSCLVNASIKYKGTRIILVLYQ